MKILNNKDKKNVKTYMKYKNGEIITVEVEEKPVNKNKDIFIPKAKLEDEEVIDLSALGLPSIVEEEPVLENKEDNTTLGKIKKLLKTKVLKTTITLIIVIIFLFIFYDAYKAFFTNNISENTNTTSTVTQYNNTNKEGNKVATNKESQNSLNQILQLNEQLEKPTLKDCLKRSNSINILLVEETNSEVVTIKAYLNNKVNRVTLQNTIKNKLQIKQKLYINLVLAKEAFEEQGALELYNATETRLLNSLKLTKIIADSFNDGGNRVLVKQAVEDFLITEKTLTELQNKELINVLNKNNIKYEIKAEDIIYEIN